MRERSVSGRPGSRALRAALVGAALLLQGCIIQYPNLVHEGWSGEVDELRQGRERLDLSVVSIQMTSGTGAALPSTVASGMADGPFRISTSAVSPDLTCRSHASTTEHSPSALSLLSVLTVGLVPNKSTYRLSLDVEFLAPDGRLLRSYRRDGSYEAWVGWVFLFWGLAFYDEEAETRALVDMARDITREIYTHDYEAFAELAREKQEARAERSP